MTSVKRNPLLLLAAGVFVIATGSTANALGPDQRSSAVAVEHIKVHGRGLEGNLEGDSPNRDVAVFLPPSYWRSKNRRYPVIYMLPGLTESVSAWFGPEKRWRKLADVMNRAIANGVVEMIIVVPDAYTRYEGSMYSISVTTGDWENYIADELVAYIDSRYRTLARVHSRGIAGHSMGGYGALRIGMRRPDVFSAIYALSPCCLTPAFAVPQDAASAARMEAVKTLDDLAKADLGTRAAFASAAAWSPNPKNPPFFVDLPWRDGVKQPMVIAKWTSNRPVVMVDQYVPNLRRLRGIGFDAGSRDVPEIAASVKTLDEELSAYAIAHAFEIYDGDHQSGVTLRLETVVLPFFGRTLDVESSPAKH
jgi:S-formylglutathione hydrolase FrmB